MLVTSLTLHPIIKYDLDVMEKIDPQVYSWLIRTAKRIGMSSGKLQVKLDELFQKQCCVIDLTDRLCRIVRS